MVTCSYPATTIQSAMEVGENAFFRPSWTLSAEVRTGASWFGSMTTLVWDAWGMGRARPLATTPALEADEAEESAASDGLGALGKRATSAGEWASAAAGWTEAAAVAIGTFDTGCSEADWALAEMEREVEIKKMANRTP